MAITSAIMQMRRGYEADFDADKMRPGEWAVSTDKKYVRMCFSPGVCVRMATYDAFEADMAKIEAILSECRDIQTVVNRINEEVSANAKAVAEYTEQAKQYRDEAKQFRDEAEQFAPEGYVELQEAVASNTAKIDTIIEKAELNIKNIASGENIHLTDSANGKNVAFGLYGKAEQNGEPTPDNPIEITVSGSDGSVEVVSCGKNLLKITSASQMVNGVTFTINEDNSIAITGTPTITAGSVVFNNVFENHLEVGKEYLYAIGENAPLSGYSIVLCDNNISPANGNYIIKGTIRSAGDKAVFSITEEEKSLYPYIWIQLGCAANVTNVNSTFYPMLRLASDTDDTYEPYTETTSTIPTPDGLVGIKVSSGGNYTDENGQQWICDEIIKYADGSGKRIQRIDSVDMGTLAWEYLSPYFKANDLVGVVKEPIDNKGYSHALSTCFVVKNYDYLTENNNGLSIVYSSSDSHGQIWCKATDYTDVNSFMEIINEQYLYYELSEPIITDLSAEEIAEIEKLHTFYPVTNISNDADCGMSVTYLADAKNYIDNRLSLIESVMLNNI